MSKQSFSKKAKKILYKVISIPKKEQEHFVESKPRDLRLEYLKSRLDELNQLEIEQKIDKKRKAMLNRTENKMSQYLRSSARDESGDFIGQLAPILGPGVANGAAYQTFPDLWNEMKATDYNNMMDTIKNLNSSITQTNQGISNLAPPPTGATPAATKAYTDLIALLKSQNAQNAGALDTNLIALNKTIKTGTADVTVNGTGLSPINEKLDEHLSLLRAAFAKFDPTNPDPATGNAGTLGNLDTLMKEISHERADLKCILLVNPTYGKEYLNDLIENTKKLLEAAPASSNSHTRLQMELDQYQSLFHEAFDKPMEMIGRQIGISAGFTALGAFVGAFVAPMVSKVVKGVVWAFTRVFYGQEAARKIEQMPFATPSAKNMAAAAGISGSIVGGVMGGLVGAASVVAPVGFAFAGICLGALACGLAGATAAYLGRTLYQKIFGN